MASRSRNPTCVVGSSMLQKKKGRKLGDYKRSLYLPYLLEKNCGSFQDLIKSRSDFLTVCEGKCSTWLHRESAVLFKASFVAATISDSPHACMQCTLNYQESEIATLKSTISKLVGNVKVLTSKLAMLTVGIPTEGNEVALAS